MFKESCEEDHDKNGSGMTWKQAKQMATYEPNFNKLPLYNHLCSYVEVGVADNYIFTSALT